MDYVETRSIEFAKWLITTKMYLSDLTYNQLYEIFLDKEFEDMYEKHQMEEIGHDALMSQWDA
jgi:hypothetical protein